MQTIGILMQYRQRIMKKNIVNRSSICLNLFTRYTRSNHTI